MFVDSFKKEATNIRMKMIGNLKKICMQNVIGVYMDAFGFAVTVSICLTEEQTSGR